MRREPKKPDFWGVNPELLQHEGMCLINSVLTVSYLIACKKLKFLHFGSQMKGQFDGEMRAPGRLECPTQRVVFLRRSSYTKPQDVKEAVQEALPTVFHSVWREGRPHSRCARELVPRGTDLRA